MLRKLARLARGSYRYVVYDNEKGVTCLAWTSGGAAALARGVSRHSTRMPADGGSRGTDRSDGTHPVDAEKLVPHVEQLLHVVPGNGNLHSTHLPT